MTYYQNNPEENDNQKALRKIANEIIKNSKKGKYISEDDARIFDKWCEEYKIKQHHQTQLGSGKHWKLGLDHTHYYRLHIPFK